MEPLLERCEDWHCCRSRSQNMMTRIALEHIPGGVGSVGVGSKEGPGPFSKGHSWKQLVTSGA